MNKRDPWATPAPVSHDPFDPWAPAAQQSAAPAPKREREAFQMGSGQFVGPDTDPLSGGPDWDQGPRQRP